MHLGTSEGFGCIAEACELWIGKKTPASASVKDSGKSEEHSRI
jgi:hypothetical protein